MSTVISTDSTQELKLVTFNLLAPCYHKIDGVYESNNEALYMKRNTDICNAILDRDADIICLQEFWNNDKIKQLFHDKFSANYYIKILPRTSGWRTREDGLAMLINKNKLLLQDSKDILFHDAGDRVAQLLLLAVKPTSLTTDSTSITTSKTAVATPTVPPAQFICVNTHLLFPHNTFSTSIRVREVSKILDFIESYKQTTLCDNICGRSDVRLVVYIYYVILYTM